MHYRDYVMDSFNSNNPFNAFVKEQIAGDELATRLLDGLPKPLPVS